MVLMAANLERPGRCIREDALCFARASVEMEDCTTRIQQTRLDHRLRIYFHIQLKIVPLSEGLALPWRVLTPGKRLL